MRISTPRRSAVLVAALMLTVTLLTFSPATAQEAEVPAPASLCTTGFAASALGNVLPPAPIEQQAQCGPCLLDGCFGVGVRCSFTGCGPNDCCAYTCSCDESCASGGIPFNACPIRLPICDHCGNGDVDFGEECDGTNLGGETCESQGFHAGTLSCDPTCMFDTSQCIDQPVCGNGVCEWGENCETCSNDCAGRTTGKPSNRFCCGNGVLEPAEGNGSICDGNP